MALSPLQLKQGVALDRLVGKVGEPSSQGSERSVEENPVHVHFAFSQLSSHKGAAVLTSVRQENVQELCNRAPWSTSQPP